MTDVRGRLARLGSEHPRRGTLLTSQEAGSEPIKWLKYTVLDRLGLEPLEKTRSQVRRYSIGRLEEARAASLAYLSEHGEHSMVVAKVVPWEIGAQLQNFRMFNSEEVDREFAHIASLDHLLNRNFGVAVRTWSPRASI